jgi:exopolysaccharide biosynthesis WecB/TagA/CpsF family protein
MKHVTAEELINRVAALPPLPTASVLGFDLVDATTQEAVAVLMSPGRRKVAFMNAHCANMARGSENYAHALRRADYILPDGIGIEMAARMTRTSISENLNGTDFAPEVLKAAAAAGKSVFLLGGKPGTAEAAAEAIARRTPGLVIAGTRDGFAGMVGAVDAINASKADILLVAMGVPLQDVWIDRNFDALNVDLAMGVGALFDFWAGHVSRAPQMVRNLRAEWVWRLAQEPRRLAKRYLIGNITFLAHAALYRVSQTTKADAAKRAVDIAMSAGALLCLSPLLLLVAAGISLESRGAPIFKQIRVGKDGRRFTLYKFRSMYKDAEARRAAILADSDRTGVCFKSKTDPRVTKIGRIIRRYSIDELPQIFNVLKGDMSIVGPRPGLPSEVAEYSNLAQMRLEAKPGLTGLWQVSGRADIGFDQMIAMDLAYIRSRSLLLDAMIIGLTVRIVLSGRGAY